MAEPGWIAVEVVLLGGRGEQLERPPGRVLIASPDHTLAELAAAIDQSFGRWDIAHLHGFELDGQGQYMLGGSDFDASVGDSMEVPLASLDLASGSSFTYVFDLGDDWMHACTVEATGVDPEQAAGIVPKGPVPVEGWGTIPDQYGRLAREE